MTKITMYRARNVSMALPDMREIFYSAPYKEPKNLKKEAANND